ncbi:DNA polymerase III subunit gamma/tau [Thiomicrorhabdus cannonii]|uniref:DNA polymerase III subunit gamma/tau n=1 Tax=Thiomicrorhabdus cannonii TaxID=2748011 RepID=UPI0015BEA6E6|nr:DNA polymerase III subunit gamma/tau [Thiomicrorhabdus cannonii]
MSYTVLARKWRPKNFAELVGQSHVMQALSNALDQNRLHHAYLFTGTRGVGKTTIARIFAKALNCEQGVSSKPCGVCDSCRAIDEGRFIDLIEVDAASRTKVDDTREILDNVQFAPTQGRYKVYLIDEVHMLSKSSFNALLKTLEEPPAHVKFLLATTDPHKLPITVLSRCLQFNLMRLTQTQIQNHLEYILQQEGLPFEPAALALIAKSADGSARDSLSLLDQAIAYGGGEIHYEPVQTMLGLVDQQFTLAILQALAADSPAMLKQVIQQLASMGVDYAALLAQLIEVLHALAFKQVLGQFDESALLPEAVIEELAGQIPPERVQLLYQIALLAKQDMQLAPDIRIGFEMALLRMLAFQPAVVAQHGLTPALPEEEGLSPQEVLAGLSSARDLISKKKPLNPEVVSESPPPVPPVFSEVMVEETRSAEVVTVVEEPPAVEVSDHLSLIKQRLKQPLKSRHESPQTENVAEPSWSSDASTVQPAWSMSPVPVNDVPPVSDLEEPDLQEALPPWMELPESEAEAVAVSESVPQTQQAGLHSAPPAENPLNAPQGLDYHTLTDANRTQVWLELLERLQPEGMAAELARQSVLVSYSPQVWKLSVDPEQQFAKTDMAVLRLTECIQQTFGGEIQLQFASFDRHDTPAKYALQQSEYRQQQAVVSIQNDPNVAMLQAELGMEVIAASIAPV